MMEWLLNIQQAVKSMQGVVGRLHYGGASLLQLFISFSFYFSTTASELNVFFPPLLYSHNLIFPAVFSSPISSFLARLLL